MLIGLRTWLAELLMPEIALAPPALAPIAVAKAPVAEKARDADNDGDHERSARRAREAEGRVSKAEERARRAEVACKTAQEAEKSAVTKLADETARARRAEIQLKKELDAHARSGKGKRGKGDALEAKLATAHEKLNVALSRISEAERDLLEAAQNQKALEARNEALARDLGEAEKALSDGPPERSLAPESRHAGGVTRRDAPRTHLEAFFSPSDDCPQAIVKHIEAAQRSVDVCVFTVTDDRIANTVLEAHHRGVKVRIITDNDKAYDEGSDIRRLSRAGIEVREDDSPFHMHHKFAIFDGRMMLTGSYNWTRGAARNNQENLVVSNDPRLITAFEREFGSLWTRYAKNDRGVAAP